MDSLRSAPTLPRETVLRIVAASTVIAAVAVAALGFFGGEIRRAHLEQAQISDLSESVAAFMIDFDDRRAREDVSRLDWDRDSFHKDRNALGALSGSQGEALAQAYEIFDRKTAQEVSALRAGDHARARKIDSVETTSAFDDLHDKLRAAGERCTVRAEAGTAGMFGTVIASLLLGVAFVVRFAIRHQRKIAAVAALDSERQSARASERRYRLLYRIADAMQHSAEPGEAIALALDLLGDSLGALRCDLHEDAEANGAKGDVFGGTKVVGSTVQSPLRILSRPDAFVTVFGEPSRVWSHEEIALIEEVIARCASHVERADAQLAQEATERQNRYTADLLEAQLNSSPDGILIVDPYGKKILQNVRMADVWGVPKDLVDESDDERQIAMVLARVKDPERFLANIRNAYSDPECSQRDEIELIDGTIIERHTAPARGVDGTIHGRIWTFRDVTDRIEAERAKRTIEHQSRWMSAALEAQMNASSEGIIIVDGNNRRILQNRRFAKVWGLPEDVLDDEDDDRQFALVCESVKDLDAFTGIFPELRANPNTIYRGEIELKNGTVLERYSSPAAGADGAVLGRIWTFRDVTERIQAERALREAHEELEARVEQRTAELVAATQEAERANAAKSEFVSRISHELRTPLNAILGFGQILQRQALDATQQESVGFILKGGRHLLGLINEVLDLSRAETGHSELSIEPVPVAEVLAESLAMVRTMAADRGLHLLEDGLPALETHVAADRQRLKQVLINLLSNAVKYNRPGGQVTARCREEAGCLRISIEDTGIGLSPEDLAKLFTPFERLGAASTEVEGTGLGLFLSQRLVAAMDGELIVESVVGEGSAFTIVLKLALSPTESLNLVEGGHSDVDRSEGEAGTFSILSIEDNSSNVRLLEAIFADRKDILLSTASEGAVGFAQARAEQPDLILLDLTLPDIAGIDVLRRLKRSGATRHIPVIVVSADSGEEKVQASLASGAARFLPKPLDVAAFRRAVDEVLTPALHSFEAALPIAA